jgi:hypothetical protein
MAVIRANPKCPKCNGIIHAIYKDQSDLPSIQQIIGDTFIKWDWENHKCITMKTAVEWLEEQIRFQISNSDKLIPLIKQAKEMEKQNTEDAFNESRLTYHMIGFKHESFEQYYNQKFKS